MHRWLIYLFIVLALTSCGDTGGKKDNKSQQSKAKSEKKQNSVIDQELKKQVDMFKEIQQYEIKQEEKYDKQTKERYKKLEKESKKQDAEGKGEDKKDQDKESKDKNKGKEEKK